MLNSNVTCTDSQDVIILYSLQGTLRRHMCIVEINLTNSAYSAFPAVCTYSRRCLQQSQQKVSALWLAREQLSNLHLYVCLYEDVF